MIVQFITYMVGGFITFVGKDITLILWFIFHFMGDTCTVSVQFCWCVHAALTIFLATWTLY